MNQYCFAAVDIGSNAVRLLVSNVFEHQGKVSIKKQSLVRVPVRLGNDAFIDGKISPQKVESLCLAMMSYKYLLKIYNPIRFRALATSALREASNSAEILDRVYNETGIKIEIVSGKEEAEVIYANGLRENMDADKNYLYMDIGGGSTELTLFSNHQAIAAKSFNIGSIRLLTGKVTENQWRSMKAWVKGIKAKVPQEISLIGSGGNVNKYCKILGKEYGDPVAGQEIVDIYKKMKEMSQEDLITKMYLNPDRADVIVPAGKIFSSIIKWGDINTVFIPKIGVSDGVVRMLYNQHIASSVDL